MKLSLIPAPEKAEYLNGFTKADTEIIKVSAPEMGREEFSIHIENRIEVRASSEEGFFYAENALEQIRFQCGMNLPNVHIHDTPKYKYRAFMMDCCRHFFDVDDIKRMISYGAKMRFNVFHWHLTDDQGWRPEIKAYPELVEIGSKRYGNHFGKEQNDKIHEGYFTYEQMKEVVDFAHKHYMKVVPEIDMPGHSSALLASIPNLACQDKKVQIKTTGGIFNDIICAGNEKTYETLFTILDEICDIFPDEYIHLGGDEAPKQQWKTCPCCQQRITDENLSGEEALQGYFINRIKDHLEAKGKRVITWNESLKSGNLDEDIIVQRWLDPKEMSKNSPNKIIVSDFSHMYSDYPYAMTPLKKVYNYDTDINGNVIGTDIPVWTEYIDNAEYMEYMCFPRFIAAAQSAWCKNKPSYSRFKIELEELLPYFDIKNCAQKEEWDPFVLTRIPKIIKHFGKINPNENIRNFFLRNEHQEVI